MQKQHTLQLVPCWKRTASSILSVLQSWQKKAFSLCECFSDFLSLFVCVWGKKGVKIGKKRNLGRSHSESSFYHPPNAARYHSTKYSAFSPPTPPTSLPSPPCCCEFPTAQNVCVVWSESSWISLCHGKLGAYTKKNNIKVLSPSTPQTFRFAFMRENENVRMVCYIYQPYTHHSWAHRREWMLLCDGGVKGVGNYICVAAESFRWDFFRVGGRGGMREKSEREIDTKGS